MLCIRKQEQAQIISNLKLEKEQREPKLKQKKGNNKILSTNQWERN